MMLTAGNNREKLNCRSKSYIDLYEWDMPEEIRKKTAELKMKLRKIWQDYLDELEKECAYTYGKYKGN